MKDKIISGNKSKGSILKKQKGKVANMKSINKCFVCILLALTMLVGSIATSGAAKAETILGKGYVIGTSNVRVYSNTGLTSGYGWIYPTDEVTLLAVTQKYAKVRYPIGGGKTKTGYIATGKLLLATAGKVYVSKGKFTTYRRNSTSNSYGYVAANDSVLVLGELGSFTQLRYPVSGGYKFAFAKTSDVNKYLKNTSSTTQSSASNNTLGSPVPSGCKFSMKTNDSGWYGYHDINRNVSTSTPVYAICDGTVTYKQAYTNYSGTKKLTSYGNFIEFTSSNGVYKAKYCHLNKFVGASQIISSSQTVRKSGSSGVYTIKTKSVKKGEVIGYIGKTGNASGIHLHFELRKNNSRIDPTSVISGLR